MQALFKLSKNFFLQYIYATGSGYKNKNIRFLSEVSTTIFKEFMRCRRFPYVHVWRRSFSFAQRGRLWLPRFARNNCQQALRYPLIEINLFGCDHTHEMKCLTGVFMNKFKEWMTNHLFKLIMAIEHERNQRIFTSRIDSLSQFIHLLKFFD